MIHFNNLFLLRFLEFLLYGALQNTDISWQNRLGDIRLKLYFDSFPGPQIFAQNRRENGITSRVFQTFQEKWKHD